MLNRVRKNHFRILWKKGKKNTADYFTKHHPIWHHRTMGQILLKPTRKYIENSVTGKMEPDEECYGTINTGLNQTPDKRLKGIRNLALNGTRNQWLRGLFGPT